jgi:peroxiredoxin
MSSRVDSIRQSFENEAIKPSLMRPINVGDFIPNKNIPVLNRDNKLQYIKLYHLFASRHVVLATIPAAFHEPSREFLVTLIQGHKKLVELGYRVCCLAGASADALEAWAKAISLPNDIILIPDPHKVLTLYLRIAQFIEGLGLVPKLSLFTLKNTGLGDKDFYVVTKIALNHAPALEQLLANASPQLGTFTEQDTQYVKVDDQVRAFQEEVVKKTLKHLPANIVEYGDEHYVSELDDRPSTHKLVDIITQQYCVVLTVPAPWSPTCTNRHLPDYVSKLKRFQELGIQIICMATDHFRSGDAWLKSLSNGQESSISYVDGTRGHYFEQMDLYRNNPRLGLVAQRSAALLKKVDSSRFLRVIHSAVEADAAQCTLSGADRMLEIIEKELKIEKEQELKTNASNSAMEQVDLSTPGSSEEGESKEGDSKKQKKK